MVTIGRLIFSQCSTKGQACEELHFDLGALVRSPSEVGFYPLAVCKQYYVARVSMRIKDLDSTSNCLSAKNKIQSVNIRGGRRAVQTSFCRAVTRIKRFGRLRKTSGTCCRRYFSTWDIFTDNLVCLQHSLKKSLNLLSSFFLLFLWLQSKGMQP